MNKSTKAAPIKTTNGIRTAVTQREATALCAAVKAFTTATTKAKSSLGDKMLGLLRDAAKHGDMAAFNAKFITLCKLTCERQGWIDEKGNALYTSADALFKKGFKEPYGANVILWIRRVVSHPDADFRTNALADSTSLHAAYKTMVQEAKEATDAKPAKESKVSSKEPTAEEVEEQIESKEPIISPAKQQAIDLIMLLDDKQVAAVNTTLRTHLKNAKKISF